MCSSRVNSWTRSSSSRTRVAWSWWRERNICTIIPIACWNWSNICCCISVNWLSSSDRSASPARPLARRGSRAAAGGCGRVGGGPFGGGKGMVRDGGGASGPGNVGSPFCLPGKGTSWPRDVSGPTWWTRSTKPAISSSIAITQAGTADPGPVDEDPFVAEQVHDPDACRRVDQDAVIAGQPPAAQPAACRRRDCPPGSAAGRSATAAGWRWRPEIPAGRGRRPAARGSLRPWG